MTKEELAEKFAEELSAEMKVKIKEAYLKGYEQGELKVASTINIDNVEYVDLGLPSGTLWSRTPLISYIEYRNLSYLEAQKLNIPTEEQHKELIANRATLISKDLVYAIGPNGERILYDWAWKGEGIENQERLCWLKGESKDNKAKAFTVWNNAVGFSEYITNHFTGYKLPVFLVKNKAEL